MSSKNLRKDSQKRIYPFMGSLIPDENIKLFGVVLHTIMPSPQGPFSEKVLNRLFFRWVGNGGWSAWKKRA